MKTNDIDVEETQEWLDAVDSVLNADGNERAQYLLEETIKHAKQKGIALAAGGASGHVTPYINTISVDQEVPMPGDRAHEERIQALIRWNAAAMVVGAGRQDSSLGGHIGTYASSSTLYEVGFNHFFRGPDSACGGDFVYYQGHSSPGIYARSFLEGRFSETQMTHFRQESKGQGISSYPHPWLMPDYWQFATVSMGLGPIQAIFQARYQKYLQHREIIPTTDRHVWCFCGDGEMDEPESLGSITLASRERLDNLIFVINCNLQRLDGPVRGNSNIVKELESVFSGAGWNVIKVLWSSDWDPLFAKDTSGLLAKRMDEVCDGEFQSYKARGGAYLREKFFGHYPELLELVADMTDDELIALRRGGHDPVKVYNAYKAAMASDKPTVVLAKTVKGFGMGRAGEARNVAHNQKKMTTEELLEFRDRFDIPVTDTQVENAGFYRPDENAPEMQYLREQRARLGGCVPQRQSHATALAIPAKEDFAKRLLTGSGEREMSTTTAFVQILAALAKDKQIGRYLVPICPDESRTFGMEGLFRQLGIYACEGQKYEPEDRDQIMYYKESKDGQILQEGLNEAGAFSSWLAAATSYSTSAQPMIPFYIYYSMFGFQRIGDLAWAAGDMQARGFLIGGTSGRTTLNGEGLQHEDGHSHILASTIPNCRSYDPTYAYELAVIIEEGMRVMYAQDQSVYYYITTMNENYVQKAMPEGVEEGILKGLYLLEKEEQPKKQHVQLLGSGSILREVEAAAVLLAEDFNISADVWSMTSANELYREGQEVRRWNWLHPEQTPRVPYMTQCLEQQQGPIVSATDYMHVYSEQLRALMPKGRAFVALGTDGFGRSDTREALRHHFEVDRYFIVLAALNALVEQGDLTADHLSGAMKKYNINPEKPYPFSV